jgi:hypothetical protein
VLKMGENPKILFDEFTDSKLFRKKSMIFLFNLTENSEC